MIEARRTDTVLNDGLSVAPIPPSQVVAELLRTSSPKKYRQAGRLQGKIVIAHDFKAPLPEMEPYS